MKPFEIPYNFDKTLIDFLNIYNINIHSIYLPPFQNHYITTRHFYRNLKATFPTTLVDYEEHIKFIIKNNYSPMLLLQRRDKILPSTLIQYYINIGINKFCVGSIEQAKIIKEISQEIEIIGSITMQINKEKILNNNYNDFTGFVLFFPFNRDIQKIKELPRQFTYTLLVNSGCNIFCDGLTHWSVNSIPEEQNIMAKCPRRKDATFKHNIYIPNIDIPYFEPYINYIKLQGREYSTQQLINEIVYYNYDNLNKFNSFKRTYNPNEIYNIKRDN